MTTPREILERAQTVLDEEGWIKGEEGPQLHPGKHCLIGGLKRAWHLETNEQNLPRTSQAYFHATQYVTRAVAPLQVGLSHASITYFNDIQAKSVDDVKDVLVQATKLAIQDEEQA